MTKARRTLALLLCAVALTGAACSTDSSASTADDSTTGGDDAATTQEQPAAAEDARPAGSAVFPAAEWETVDAAEAGLDQAALDAIAADAEAGLSNCLVVTRGGKLVDEWYWQGTGPDSAQEVFSASKSFTSVIMGIAADDGAFEVQDRASEWIPQWQGTDSEEITIEQILSNTSGRFYDFETDYVEMAARAQDKTAFAIGLDQQHRPGTEWVYNNSAIQSLEQVFSGSTGQDMADFAAQRLFGPLGMQDSSIIRDAAGNPLAFMGVQSTCRDMARFGLLSLRDGNWDGRQVVSEEWMEASTGAPSQDLNSAYGWLWWLNEEGTIIGGDQASGESDKGGASQLVAGAPTEMFFALGLGGQMIAVDPATETVVVRLGESAYPDDIEKFERSDIVRVVTEAVL